MRKVLRFMQNPHQTHVLSMFDLRYFHIRSHLFSQLSPGTRSSCYTLILHCLTLISRYFCSPTCAWCWINHCTLNIITTDACTFVTRASAQRVTNTPSWCHFLIIKYFKANDNDIRQDIVNNVSLWVTLIYHPKYNFPGVNSLQEFKQICWAIKYRSLTYTYLR